MKNMPSWRLLSEWVAASTMRSQREPCLEMWPRRVCSALERSVGVSPAQPHRWSASGKRAMSPISARMMAAVVGPIPGMGSSRLVRESVS